MQLTQPKPFSAKPASKCAAVVATWTSSRVRFEADDCLDCPHALAATVRDAIDYAPPGDARAKEIHRPTIEIHAVNEVVRGLSRFVEMFP